MIETYNSHLPNKSVIRFNELSYTYCSIVCGLLVFMVISVNNLDLVMRLSKISFIGTDYNP